MSRLRKRNPSTTSNPVDPTVPKKIPRLYRWSEIPLWQQDNSYIHSGYVRETLSYVKTLASLTYLHNESVNIYTHLVPGVACFFSCFYLVNTVQEKFDSTTWKDYAMFCVFLGGAACALSLSGCFHTLKSHSEGVMVFGNKLDYLGIIVLITASMISLLYYAWIDSPLMRNVFVSITVGLAAICAVFSLKSRFRSSEWRPYRASMFVLFGLSGVLPIVTGAYLMGIQETAKRAQVKWIVLEGVLYCFGALLYAMRIPERWWPGKFDIVGNSHQIFHVLVVIAACCHGKGLIGAYEYAHQNYFLSHDTQPLLTNQ